MARAVEAVAADAVVLVILIRNGVHIGLAGHGLVECGVEHGDHRHVVAHDGAAGVDAGDVGGVVQRGKRRAFLERGHDGVVDLDGTGKLLTAVDDTVANGVDLLHGGDHTVLGAGQFVDDRSNRLGVGGHRQVFVKERGVLEVAVDADALAQTFGQDVFGLHVDQLILQGGAAGIDDKNFHTQIPFSYKIL